MFVKVKDGKRGFLGGRLLRSGDKFECSQDAFSDIWMEELKDEKPKPKPKAKPKAKPKKKMSHEVKLPSLDIPASE